MRLFIAILLPAEIKRQLHDYAAALAAASSQARPTRQENYHLTLAFLGEALALPAARTALDTLPQPAPFKLYSDKPGRFARPGGDIHWLGFKPSPALAALHQALNAALAQQGFAAEQKPFRPHLTLAREVRGLQEQLLPPAPRFILPVNGLALMNSEHIEGRLTYTPLYQSTF